MDELIAPLPICLATLAFYALPRAAYLLWFERPPLSSAALPLEEEQRLIALTLSITTIAAIALLLGHGRESAVRVAIRATFSLPKPAFHRSLWTASAAGIVGALALLFLVQRVGGVPYALAHQYEVSSLLRDYQPVFQLTRLMIVPVALLLVDPARRRSRAGIWLLAAVVAVILFPLGRRSFVLLAIGYPIVLYHLTVRRLPLRWMVPLAVVAGISLFTLNYIRRFPLERLASAGGVFFQQPTSVIHFAFNSSGELKVFDAATIVVRDVPSAIPLNFGVTFARVPWMIIPRQLWPEKPVTFAETIVRTYVPDVKAGYPPLAVGEFYAAGGPLAVPLGFFALGWLGRVVFEWHRRRAGPGNASIYVAFCFFVFDFTRVGDPSRTAWFFILGLLFFSTAFSIAARRSTSNARPQPSPT